MVQKIRWVIVGSHGKRRVAVRDWILDLQSKRPGAKNDIQLADSGYGQGEVLMSPLHVAVAYTALANGGNLIAPQLVYQEGRTQGTVWKKGAIKPNVASLLTQDLEKVIEGDRAVGCPTVGFSIR